MDSDLLAPACAAVLDGWCGPVVWSRGGCCVTLHEPGYVDAGEVRVADPEGLMYAPLREVSIDLARAEVRDRVARVLAARRDEPGPGAIALRANRYDTSLYIGGYRVADSRSVPALASLDPHDDARLPDGSRRVDALALMAVYMEACCEK